MQIYIDGYKNLHDFTMNITDKKTNVLFGMSGSGKSSVSEALQKLDIDFNKTIGSESLPVIQVNGSDNLPYIRAFTKETVDELLLSEEANNIYDVLVDDSNEIRKAEKEYRKRLDSLIAAISSEDGIYQSYKQITSSLGSKLTKNKELKKTAKIVKLANTMISAEDTRTLKSIKQMPPGKYAWVLQGRQFIVNNNCPYCEKKLSSTRLKKLDKLETFKDNSYKSVVEITTKYPAFASGFDYTKSMIVDLKKNVLALCIACNNYLDIKEQIEKINSAKIQELDKKTFELTAELKTYFPTTYSETKRVIAQIEIINRLYKNARNKTKTILSRRLQKINKLLSIISVPYKIDAEYSNGRIQSYKMSHVNDVLSADRRKSLSFGETNVVALIMFVLKCKSLDDELIIIDDPASAFDDYRRNQIYGFITDELNGRTVLLLSHDSIFAKYALVDTKKHGSIYYMENDEEEIRLKEITAKDFDDFENYVKERIITSGDYYQRIFNIRLLYEGSHNSIAYQYLSAIIHRSNRKEIDKLLRDRGSDEEKVFKRMVDRYPWIHDYLIPYSDSFALVDVSGWSLLEKAFIIRECYAKELKNDGYKKALDDFVHINRKLKVCLNPYRYEFCTSLLRKYLLQKENGIEKVFSDLKKSHS